MTWRLYVTEPGSGNLEVFDSSETAWADAPGNGVVAIAVPHDYVGREILTNEFYLLLDGNDYPQGSDLWGVVDHLIRRDVVDADTKPSDIPVSVLWENGVKLGVNLDSDDWRVIHAAIVADADKWGTTRRERPV